MKYILLSLMLMLSPLTLAHDTAVYTYNAELIEVKDGDTMDMRIDMGLGMILEDTIRVLGIDTPETWRPRNDAEEKHGKEATARARELLSAPYSVVVYGRGSFGRVLAEIVLEDGRSYSEVMRSEGFQKRQQY